MIREVPFGTVVEGKRAGAFLALTAWARVYENYDDPSMTPEYRASLFPMVLMMHRWDGMVGFVGGFLDAGRTLAEQVEHEANEEVGTAVVAEELVPLIAHEAERIVVHLYLDKFTTADGETVVSAEDIRDVLRFASEAEHANAEGNVFWAHLADYGNGKGWERLRNSNNLALAVGEELDAVRAWMYANAPEGAYRGPP